MNKFYLNSLRGVYRYSFGCGPVALYNCLRYYNRVDKHNSNILNQLSKELKEYGNGLTTNKQLTKVLNEYFNVDYVLKPSLETLKKHFNSGKIAILLHYACKEEEIGVGHYTFLYGSKYVAYDSDKIIYDKELKIMLETLCPSDSHPAEIWFLS